MQRKALDPGADAVGRDGDGVQDVRGLGLSVAKPPLILAALDGEVVGHHRGHAVRQAETFTMRAPWGGDQRRPQSLHELEVGEVVRGEVQVSARIQHAARKRRETTGTFRTMRTRERASP
jgi:hypothetical protein